MLNFPFRKIFESRSLNSLTKSTNKVYSQHTRAWLENIHLETILSKSENAFLARWSLKFLLFWKKHFSSLDYRNTFIKYLKFFLQTFNLISRFSLLLISNTMSIIFRKISSQFCPSFYESVSCEKGTESSFLEKNIVRNKHFDYVPKILFRNLK